MVEVPALTGLSLEEAETVLAAAGMAVQVRSEDPNASGGVDTVVDQEPEAGVLADAATTVVRGGAFVCPDCHAVERHRRSVSRSGPRMSWSSIPDTRHDPTRHLSR